VFFKNVELENFLSFARERFEFPEKGLILLEGENLDEGDSNGSGKSSIWDGIAWCIWGETLKGLRGDDVVSWGRDKDCRVGTEFVLNDKLYQISRYRKHSKFGERLIVDVDGKPQEKGTPSLTQKWLDEEIGFDLRLFKSVVVFSQGDNFNFVNESDKKQKEILSTIRNVDFSYPLGAVREKLKAVEQRVNKLGREIEIATARAGDINVRDLEILSSEFENERVERVGILVAKKAKCKSDLERLEKQKSDVAGLEAVKMKINVEVSKVKAKMDLARGRRDKALSEHATSSGYIDRMNALGEVCPTCENRVDVRAKEANVTFQESRRERFKKVLDDLDDFFSRAEVSIGDLESKKSLVNSKLIEKKSAVSTMRMIRKELEQATLDVEAKKNEPNPYLKRIEKAESQIQAFEDEIKSATRKIKDIQVKIPYFRFWEQGFSDKGIKSFLFDMMCGSLNAKCNGYLNVLTTGDVSVKFDTQSVTKAGDVRERISCDVRVGERVVPYAAYSGGEKTRISLATDMSLTDLMCDYHGSEFNLLVHDEQDTYLDGQGRQNYLKLLKERAKNQCVIVVAHDREFRGLFDTVWTIQKENGVSRRVV
jgi:DNA repair exonuclease SbcCD ATPase subunit